MLLPQRFAILGREFGMVRPPSPQYFAHVGLKLLLVLFLPKNIIVLKISFHSLHKNFEPSTHFTYF